MNPYTKRSLIHFLLSFAALAIGIAVSNTVSDTRMSIAKYTPSTSPVDTAYAPTKIMKNAVVSAIAWFQMYEELSRFFLRCNALA